MVIIYPKLVLKRLKGPPSGIAPSKFDPRLRQKLDGGEVIAAPGISDMVTAIVANKLKVEVVYASGYWVTAMAYGIPDVGIATYTEMLECMSRLARVSYGAVIAGA